MSQDFTLGRCGLATSAGGDGLELKCSSFEQSGDECKASGVIRGQSSVNDVNALRQQLSGYDLNTDEPVVPVTWVQDPSIDGFYRVQSVEVSAEVTGRQRSTADGAELAFRWEVELLRVPGWQAPLFEILCSGADRSTAHVITEWSWLGAPNAILTSAEVLESRVSGAVIGSISGAGNDSASLVAAPTGSKTAFYDDAYTYSAPVGSFYAGAARLEYSIDGGTTWRILTGRHVPFNELTQLTYHLRLNNGAIRLEVPNSSGFISLDVYDSVAVAYESKSYMVTTGGSSASSLGYGPPTVLRNDPAAVTVRHWFGTIGGVVVGYCDFTVRRGSWVVEGYANALGANAQLGVFRSSNEAGTGVTGGIDATSDDAAGNKYQLRSPSAVTAETTKGGIYLTSSAQTFPFAIATDALAGDNTTFPSTSGLYFAAMNHRQQIAAR